MKDLSAVIFSGKILCGILILFLFIRCSNEKEFSVSTIEKGAILAENSETYYSNGKLKRKGILINGKEQGIWRLFDEKENLLTEIQYRLGKVNKVNFIINNDEGKFGSIISGSAIFSKTGYRLNFSAT